MTRTHLMTRTHAYNEHMPRDSSTHSWLIPLRIPVCVGGDAGADKHHKTGISVVPLKDKFNSGLEELPPRVDDPAPCLNIGPHKSTIISWRAVTMSTNDEKRRISTRTAVWEATVNGWCRGLQSHPLYIYTLPYHENQQQLSRAREEVFVDGSLTRS